MKRKQKRFIARMVVLIALLTIILLTVILINVINAGFKAKKYEKNASVYTLIMKKNDELIEVAIEDYSETNIASDDISEYVKGQVKIYNSDMEKPTVKVKNLNTKDLTQVKLVLAYKNMHAFNEFNLTNYQMDKLNNIKEEILKGNYTSKDGETISFSDIKEKDKLQAIIIDDIANIAFYGSVLYYNEEVILHDDIATTSGEDMAVIIYRNRK